ncbi:MAG: ChbG/HpnK family deacetylase [Chloroflexota bacterium]
MNTIPTSILIVNADDFGMTEGHNRAIVDAYRSGIVRSTSLLANGGAFENAVALARQHPVLGIGIHLTLTEGSPVASDVPELLGSDGKLPLSNQPFTRSLMLGGLPMAAIRREFMAQANKIVATGINPTHVDGHKYIHLLPGISSIAAEVARQFNIPVMRVPFPMIDSYSRRSRIPGLIIIALLGRLARVVARRANLFSSDWVGGFVETGHLTTPVIQRLLATKRQGVTELLCHPAYRSPELDVLLSNGYRWIINYDFETETKAVSDSKLRHTLEAAGWTLRNFNTLTKINNKPY